MLKLVFEFCTYLMAAYGIFCLAVSLVSRLYCRVGLPDERMKLFLMVKNTENMIEGVVRSIFLNNLLKNTIPAQRLYIIDMGSSDDTRKILSRLEKEYDSISVIREDENERLISVFSHEQI
jgi:hypothetical protein